LTFAKLGPNYYPILGKMDPILPIEIVLKIFDYLPLELEINVLYNLEITPLEHSSHRTQNDNIWHHALKHGDLDLINWLAETGLEPIDINLLDEVAALGNVVVYAFLEAYGVEEATKQAMNWACRNGCLDMVRYLGSRGVEPTSLALDWAASKGHLDICKYFKEHMEQGCNESAIEKAIDGGHIEVAEYLFGKFSIGAEIVQEDPFVNEDANSIDLLEKGSDEVENAAAKEQESLPSSEMDSIK
jgi:hypothetical protein